MNDREGGERGSGISMLMARDDDDDDKFAIAKVFSRFYLNIKSLSGIKILSNKCVFINSVSSKRHLSTLALI